MPEPSLQGAVHPQLRPLLSHDGPTHDELKVQQQPGNEIAQRARETADILVHHGGKHVAIHLITDGAAHFASAAAANKIHLVGRAIGTVVLAYEVTKDAYKYAVTEPMIRGKNEGASLARDQQNLGLLMLVNLSDPSALPGGYFDSERSRVLGREGLANLNKQASFKMASLFHGKVLGGDSEAVRSKDILVASMREGVATAYQRAIGSDATLQTFLKTDPDFRVRYESDPAFRNGIKSVIWQAGARPAEYEQAVLLNMSNRNSSGRL